MGSTHSDSSILVASDDPNFSVGGENTSVNFSDDLKNANTLWVDLPARRMWGWTKGVAGYCGECSLQSAGLYYGNYFSQEHVRYAAGNAELLLGVNDECAARALHLCFEAWPFERAKNPHQQAYLQWVRTQLQKQFPVISGFYMKQQKGDDADDDYDHIMPIVGCSLDFSTASSSSNKSAKTSTSSARNGNMAVATVTGLYYNDLYSSTVRYVSPPCQSRRDCLQAKYPQQPYDYRLPRDCCYGISITGCRDQKSVLQRCRLLLGPRPSTWREPDWGSENQLAERPVWFNQPQLHLWSLKPSTRYLVLRYERLDALPPNGLDFERAGGWTTQDVVCTKAGDTTLVLPVAPIRSDQVCCFRCVQAREST